MNESEEFFDGSFLKTENAFGLLTEFKNRELRTEQRKNRPSSDDSMNAFVTVKSRKPVDDDGHDVKIGPNIIQDFTKHLFYTYICYILIEL